jgi:hypothetical protein
MIPLSIIGLIFILYFAISSKSSPTVRRLAVAALILAVIALIVSAIFIITASPHEAEPGPVTLPLPVKPAEPVQRVNWQELLLFSILFLLAFHTRNNQSKAGKDDVSYQDDQTTTHKGRR